ncbi:hypothetical protein ACLKA7_009806 [Drosophila subpalustris]
MKLRTCHCHCHFHRHCQRHRHFPLPLPSPSPFCNRAVVRLLSAPQPPIASTTIKIPSQTASQYSRGGGLQKPLVRHPGDPLALEKLRQCEVHMQPPKRPSCCKTWLSKFPTRSKRIDVISRITFPLVFALFNLVYWSTYLFREEDDE